MLKYLGATNFCDDWNHHEVKNPTQPKIHLKPKQDIYPGKYTFSTEMIKDLYPTETLYKQVLHKLGKYCQTKL